MEQLTIRLSKDDMKKIRDVAEMEDRSINFILNQMVKAYFKRG